MKLYYKFNILIFLLAIITSCANRNNNNTMSNTHRIMTCNIRITALPQDSLPGRLWADRRDVIVKVIRDKNPDILCFQEVIYDSYNYLRNKFSDYATFGFEGPEMDSYTNGYHYIGKNVIFYRMSRYDLISSGTYWLSEKPLIGGSISWNSVRARHCNWIRLKDKKTGKQFRVLNIHLDHKNDTARTEQLNLVIRESAQYSPDFPQILCGDFNSGWTHNTVKNLLQAEWIEMYDTVHQHKKSGFTYHAFKGSKYQTKRLRIDFIWSHGSVNPVKAEIIRDKIDGVYPSDHYFVLSEFELGKD